MAKIPDLSIDPTLKASDEAIERRGNSQPPRPYLGMSGIGHPCLRKHWYDFHWCSKSQFDALTLRRFDDGHRSEDIQAERLRLVEGVELQTIDYETGEQFEFSDLGGHFKGHADGLVKGLLQAPRTQHIWEHKAVNEAKQKKLEKLKSEVGEKNALKEWDEIYYAQGMLYCKYGKVKRHYLTCASPGTRTVISVRTNANIAEANYYVARAKTVIESTVPPERINDDPSFYLCSWCNHHDLCHAEASPVLPEVNCRTCLHSTPELDGVASWSCGWFNNDVPVEHQRISGECSQHRYNPYLVRFADVVDADAERNIVSYQNKADGKVFQNGGEDGYSSLEIKAAGPAITDEGVNQVKKPSPAADSSSAGTIQPGKDKSKSPAPIVDTSASTNAAGPELGLAMWKRRA